MNLKVLVAGGVGYIGSLLVRDLAKDYKNIRILDNLSRGTYTSLMDLPRSAEYTFVEGDTRSPEDVRKALKGADTVIDLAGVTNAPASFKRKKLTKDVNYNGLKNLVREATKRRIKRYIYTSSCSVYGTTSGIVNETYKGKPESPYGFYKLKADRFLMGIHAKGKMNITSLRIGTVYGYSVGMRFDTVVDKFIYQACIREPLAVYKNAWSLKRPYLHVKDAVRAILFALDRPITGGQVYNVVGQNASVGEIVGLIKRYIPETKISLTKSKVLNQLSFEVDSSKIRSLGFEPRHNLNYGVKELILKFGDLRSTTLSQVIGHGLDEAHHKS